MRYVHTHPMAGWVMSGIAVLLLSWMLSTQANSQPVSQGRLGPLRSDPLPQERIASFRYVWGTGNKSATLVFRTADHREHSIRQLGMGDLHDLLEILRSGEPVYYEADTQLLYSPTTSLPAP
jgi:hypothetical protein